jgi:phosphoglycolate phosphatase
VKKLLLWDIDGTLITSGRAGEHAMTAALRRVSGARGQIGDVDYRGRTDRWIVRQLLKHHGIEDAEDRLHDFLEAYLEELRRELPLRAGRVLEGVLAVLEEASRREDIVQGLLTGNLARGARLKLEHYRVWHYFEFGAFADDAERREELGPVALRRAVERAGLEIPPARVFIIGDTPHDVACARAIGARAVAVATGGDGRAELEACGPDVVLDDFSDGAAFFAAVDRLG